MTIAALLDGMKHSPIGNYGDIASLTSWLIGAPSEHCLVRLMECKRLAAPPSIGA